MKQAVIVSTARTALAKSVRGCFNQTHGAVMGGHAGSVMPGFLTKEVAPWLKP